MLSAKIPRKKPVSSSFLKPVLPLLPEAVSKTDENKGSFITMELKSQAGGAGAGSYKKHLALFDEGTPQQWINTQKDVMEVWTQNAIKDATDKLAIVRAVLRGESLTTLDAAITEQAVDGKGDPVVLTMELLQEAIEEVSSTIFPHRALEIQKQWMRKSMKKPADLSTRATAAALARINNCLPLFPGGSDTSKFSAAEMLEILECSLPYAWRQKFDYDGYISTDGTKVMLIMNCEAIERNEEPTKKEKRRKNSPKRKG